ncbi:MULTISPECIES: contractile injection system protein, VgrG/Pvc8 family [Serratia]|uniref:contractile injection system protein, VgrG/Pvc8 family n=1 Tax=Serratia TaxID=613 RepID=UPI0013DA7E94|nr:MULTISPECIES: contractile injection system protein, VgrG/Pvc8 family [Serratia]MBH2656209.1 hypothetical protein [Serratia ureilytica]MBJ2092189.1 hypothetical protein [Serratia ureilytica]
MSTESFTNRIAEALASSSLQDPEVNAKNPGVGRTEDAEGPTSANFVTVRVGGQRVDTKDAFVEQIQMRHAVNEIPSATVVLNIPVDAPSDHTRFEHVMHLCRVGESVTVKMAKLTVFDGVVGALKITQTTKDKRQITVRLKSRLQRLKATHHNRLWKARQDTALVSELLKEHEVSVNSIALPAHESEQRCQWNSTDWHFLRAVLGLHGAWLWPHTDGRVTVKVPQLGGRSHSVSAKSEPHGVTLLDAEWEYSGLNQPQKMTTQSWDLSKQAVVKMTAKPQALGQGGLAPSTVKALGAHGGTLLTGQWEGGQQQSAVDGWFAGQQAQAVKLRLTLEGCLDWQVGDTVTLSHFGHPLDGKAIVTQVEFNCDLNARQGRTIIGVGLDEAAASAPPLVTPSGLMVAKVAPYRTDPRGKSWNRLPVTVPVLGAEILWARMGHVYASDNSGVTFYPEAGDEVVLGFVGDMPVIMASLHSPKRKAAIDPDEKNAKKGMVLRHQGQRMELSFHRGSGEAVLALGEDKKPEQQFVIDKAKGVAISSLKGDLRADVKAGGAAVATKKDIALMTDEQLLFTGKKGVKLTSDMNMTLAAQEKLTGQGKTGVHMESGEGKLALSPESADLSAVQTNVVGKVRVTVQGKEAVDIAGMSIEVKASGKAAVSGPRVTVDGTADVGLKAPRVKVDGDMTELGGAGITQVKGSMINLG